MKIAVSAISKNEAQFVERFMESCKDADYVLIADTGSTDETVSIAKGLGAAVHEISISPWRFDKARDAALFLLPKDIDIVVSLDLDEILEDGWRAEIERVWTPDTTRLRYKFDWSNGIVFYSEKIFSRHGYHWHHPVHEYIRPDGRINEVYANTDMQLVTHLPDNTKSRSQYMPLLELAVKEDPYCPRNAFYYARELTFYSQWHQAMNALDTYLAMPEATWVNDRAYAMRLLGQSYAATNNDFEAIKWHRLATIELPTAREPWVDLAMHCYKKSMWQECFYAAQMALGITDKQLVYTMDPKAWSELPFDLASIAAWNLGFKDLAIEYCQKAIEFNPSDTRLIANLNNMAGPIIRNDLENVTPAEAL